MGTKNFTELLDEYLELTKSGPADYSSKESRERYTKRLQILRDAMNKLAPGKIEVPE